MSEEQTLFADDLIGGCLIERFRCGGPVFETYLAFHPKLETHRIVRVVKPDLYGGNTDFRVFFLQNMRKIVQLQHTNMIQVCDVGWDEKPDLLYYMTNEFAASSLADRLKEQKKFSEAEAMPIVAACVSVLQMLAKNGLCHFRLSAENLLLHETRGPVLVEPGLILNGVATETSEFSAPELKQAPNSADIRADIYSLGAIWFLMLTGHLPEHPVPSRNSLPDDIAPETAKLLLSMLAEDPAKRPATPDALFDALSRLPGGMIFDNPALGQLTEQEIAQAVSERTRQLAKELQNRHLRENKIFRYSAIALAAITGILLIADLCLGIGLLLQSSQQTKQAGVLAHAKNEEKELRRQIDELEKNVLRERAAAEKMEKDLAGLAGILSRGEGK